MNLVPRQHIEQVSVLFLWYTLMFVLMYSLSIKQQTEQSSDMLSIASHGCSVCMSQSSRAGAGAGPDGIHALGVPTPGVYPALGQEAVLVLGLQVLGRLQPAASCIVLQVLSMEHGLVCGSISRHLCCVSLVLGNLPVMNTVRNISMRRNSWELV